MWALGGHTPVVFLVICSIVVLASGGLTAADTAPAVRPEHPRLLVTSADLPRLQQQVTAYPEEWKRLQSAALAAPEDGGLGDARNLTNTALAYLITREERYLTNAVSLAQNICRNHEFDGFVTPETLFGLALAYDWCYSGFTETQREEIEEGMLRMADYLRGVWRQSDTSNLFVLRKVWPFVYVALALHRGPAEPRVEEYLQLASDYLHQNLLPAANAMAGTTGGEFEGYGYDGWGYMRPMALSLEAWRTATGEDLFQSCTATRYDARWNIYGQRPFDRRLEHFDDAQPGEGWGPSTNGVYIYLLASRYRDPHAQWMGDQIQRRYTDHLWPIILWRDPNLVPQPPDDLPTAFHFDALGWVLMRSSWQPDATFASFQCGPVYATHQHMDNNAFTIHKGSLFAIDSGVNAYDEDTSSDYRTNYYSRTIAHNSITVYDPEETFRGGPWAGEPSGGANDGGQVRLRGPERVAEIEGNDRWQVGKIVAYQHDQRGRVGSAAPSLFTYAVGDATKSYSPAKLRLFRRHFLFLPPDLFVVFDQVEATDPSFRKAWLLHCVDEPSVSGNVVTITNGPFGSAQGRPGRLTCRTVLPEHPEITKVGGPGKECWVDGRNWPPVEQKWRRDAGAWRIEVSASAGDEVPLRRTKASPSQPAAQDFFLHVLQTDGSPAGGGQEIASPDAVSLTRESGRVGVLIHAQGREYQVTFAITGWEPWGEPSGQPVPPGSAHLRITEHGRTVLEKDLR